MKEEYKTQSLDQYYLDKLSEGKVDLDALAGWELLEQQGAKRGGWFTFKKLILLIGILILGLILGLLMTQTTEIETKPLKEKSSIPYSTSSLETHKKIDLDKSFVQSKDKMESIEQNDSFNSARIIGQSMVLPNTQELSKQNVSEEKAYLTNLNIKESDALDSDFSSYDKTIMNESKPLSNPFENTINRNIKRINLTDGVQAQGTSNIGINDTKKDIRSLIEFDQLCQNQFLLESQSYKKLTPALIIPSNTFKPRRWSIDVGLSQGKEYALASDFSLKTVKNKVRLAHIALGYIHLNRKYFTTRAYLSFDKIYSGEEFVGERIVRTYADDNFSGGYSLNFKLSNKIRLETGLSLGLSLIDKIEYEQKPKWVNGAKEYKDFTESRYTMEPTATYQTHGKFTYQLPHGLDVFMGATYRSQLADRLTSKEETRENTLGNFSDLRLMVGLRYYIY